MEQGQNYSQVLVPSQAPKNYSAQQMRGKSVLVVDDIVFSGNTTQKIAGWIREFNPARVYFAIVKGRADIGRANLHRSSASEHLYIDHKVAV